MMTVPAIDAKERQWSLGKLSVQIAIWIFVVTWALFIAFSIYQHEMPRKSPAVDAASGVLMAEFIAAPFGHLVGLALGIFALFRPGDRHGLAVVGILLNIAVVAIGITMAFLAASHLAPR